METAKDVDSDGTYSHAVQPLPYSEMVEDSIAKTKQYCERKRSPVLERRGAFYDSDGTYKRALDGIKAVPYSEMVEESMVKPKQYCERARKQNRALQLERRRAFYKTKKGEEINKGNKETKEIINEMKALIRHYGRTYRVNKM